MKGDGLTHSKVINLVLNHETDEYLTYFPEDANFIMPIKCFKNSKMIVITLCMI